MTPRLSNPLSKLTSLTRCIKCTILSLLLISNAKSQPITTPSGEHFSVTVLAEGLQDPWQLRLDEKGFLWFTESRSLKVIRMDLNTKTRSVMLDLASTV